MGKKWAKRRQFVDFNNTNSVTLYPNPTSDFLNINTAHSFSNAQLYIRNATGQLVKQIALNGSGTINVSVKNLLAGIYSAEVKDAADDIKLPFIKE